MYSNGISLNAASYKTLFSSTSGRLYVPVKPNVVVYAQLSHVHGTAAKAGQSTVSIDKVHLLNTLIDQLVSMKKNPIAKADVFALSDKQQDALIQKYQEQIHTAVVLASQPQTYGLAGLIPEEGIILNVAA
ncbi:MAG TPA: hypothetical protein DDW78_06710 [Treponema sp.]|nr:hypothetical protein [Treponema sp.]